MVNGKFAKKLALFFITNHNVSCQMLMLIQFNLASYISISSTW